MRTSYIEVGDLLTPHQLQLVRTRGCCGFHRRHPRRDLKVGGLPTGAHRGLAVGDADFIFMPLGLDIAITFSATALPEVDLDVAQVAQLNNLSWRNAMDQIACHPDLDWRSSGFL